jgi:Na+-driven multidrug efflux pump
VANPLGSQALAYTLPRARRAEYAALASALLFLGAPALLNSINEPVVSLLETVLVARVGTILVAALAPASALFGLVEEVCFACSVVVTTVVSKACAAEEDSSAPGADGKMRTTVSTSVFASFFAGIALATGLQLLYGPICKIMLVPEEVQGLLRAYTVLRCVGLPFFGAANAFEGVFLGTKDAMTPMIGWLITGVITAIAQVALIKPMFGNGAILAAGGALTLGQMFMFFLLWCIAVKRGYFSFGAIFDGTKGAIDATRTIYRRLREENILSEFRWLIINAASRMATYALITTWATQLGVIPAAVNKFLLDIYVLLGLLSEPVFTVGNVLLPRQSYKNPETAAMTRRALFNIALFMGCTLGAAAYCLCGSRLLSPDPAVYAVTNSLKHIVALAVGFSTTAYALDGCVIGLGGARFVGGIQVFNTAIFVGVLSVVKAAFGVNMTLAHVWQALVLFQVLRVLEHVVKLTFDEQRMLTSKRSFAALA